VDPVSRRLALAVMPLALVGLMLPGHAAGSARPAAASRPACVVPVPILCPSPSPTPSPSSSPSPAPSAAPTGSAPAPSPGASPTGSPTPDPSASPGKSPKSRKASSVRATAGAGLEVSEAQFTLVTGSALLLGASYKGVAQVPTASGRTVPMMEFTMNSLTLQGVPTLTVTQGGVSSVTSGSSMQFTGSVVLYATQLSGDLLGVPVTLTPSSPLATILQLLNSVTPLVPLRLTSVTTNQPYISSNSLQIPGLQVAS
jgi:hypothetical protein